MNPALTKTFATLYALFIAIIVAEWSYITHSADAGPQRSMTTENAELAELSLTEKTAEDYQEMVTRPLFIQGRVPVESSPETEDALPTNNQKLDIVLTAIFTQNNELHVFFEDPKAEKKSERFIKAQTGKTLENGWKLIKIASDKGEVILKQGSRQEKLKLIKEEKKKLQRQKKTKLVKDKKNKKNVKKDKK